MILQDNQLQDDTDHRTEQTGDKPNAYRVDDDNLEEKDLKRSFLVSDDDMKKQDSPGMEGKGMGGQNFGQNNLTPSGDDEANPSQTAGYTNEYFRRTQPAEEHPENSNLLIQIKPDSRTIARLWARRITANLMKKVAKRMHPMKITLRIHNNLTAKARPTMMATIKSK
ncbi:hypothetical protein [Mucilaginibacter sp. SP1R1]|uniref:hypothetical protein n=1 Tax=Mucilaginibacter sp. SP1R1 TaxID=2723091 RepID=UPI001616CFE4|nr:hypothetical protein [Mucilaginibacter sp. SP1R1]MBB6149528.1 hypothetical protein [Mucilaginibacter sp. SP1R1]